MYTQYDDQSVVTSVQKKAAPDCVAEASATLNISITNSCGMIVVVVDPIYASGNISYGSHFDIFPRQFLTDSRS